MNREEILHKLGIHSFEIVDDKIHVNQNVELIQFSEKKLPIKIHRINGYLKVRGNCLESLDNCPDIVTDYADFSYNKIRSLKGLGTGIRILIIDNNLLENLKGAENCKLYSISINHNPRITTFEGAPFTEQIHQTGLFAAKNDIPFSKWDNTKLQNQELDIYFNSCKERTWNPKISIKENLKKLLIKKPLLMETKKWDWIEEFRHDLRGAKTGEKFNL